MMKYFISAGFLAMTLLFGVVPVAEAATCALTPGKAYKTAVSPATYYITQNCTKQLLNQDQYFSYFTSWNDTMVTTQANLNRVATDAMPASFGPSYYPRTGSIVKTPNDPTVYYILWFSKNKVVSEDVFNAMGLKWEWVETIPQATLDKFTEGETIDSVDKVFNEGIYLFHYSDNLNKTHLILPDLKKGGSRRHHLKNDTLIDYIGYRRDRIPVVHPVYQFRIGDEIDNLEQFFTKYFTEGVETIFGNFDESFTSDLLNPPTTDWSDDEWMDETWNESDWDDMFPETINEDDEDMDEDSEASTFAPVDNKKDHIRGNLNAKVTVIEYVDLECPFCKMFHGTMQEVMKTYPTDVRWVYRHFPLEAIHTQARTEAIATECADEQGKFWEMVDLIFSRTNSSDGLDLSQMTNYARELGLDAPTFKQCFEDRKPTAKIDADIEDAVDAGVQGTPHSILLGPNGEVVPVYGAVPFETLDAEIQKLLQ